jgi:glycosyltransferase involved in cell wall biosynthesis
MFYIPVRGGQETYIENLHNILEQNGYQSKVIQVKRSMEQPEHVRFLPLSPKLLNKIIPDTDWFAFNFALGFEQDFLRQSNLLICHYPFHYPAICWHKNVIVLSHGVDWREPPRTLADRYRVHALQICQQKKPTIIANDTNFLRHMGINIQAGSNEFKQIEERIWYIPNCVDIEQFKPSGTKRKNVILVPRNIRYGRGIHLAIQAFHEFIKQYSQYGDYEMWIAGTGQLGRYYRYCLRLINDLKLQNNVRFLGHISWPTLADYYNQVQLTLIPTIELEGTSLSAIESMACKTPVVSTNVAGLNDLPTLKTSLESKNMAEKMVEALENWDYYSKSQYEAVLTTFNLSRWKSAWLDVIEETLR